MNQPNINIILDPSKPITFKTLPAIAGIYWITRGWALFINKPWSILAAVISILMINLTLTYLLQKIGTVILIILNPVFYLSLMGVIAIRLLPTQNNIFKHLINIINHSKILINLLRLGMAYLMSFMVSSLLTVLLMNEETRSNIQKIATDDSININNPIVQADLLNQSATIIPMMILTVLMFWFTNQLVGWHGQSIAKALFFNIMAIWRNKIPFMVYIAGWLIIGCGILILINFCLIYNIDIQVLILPIMLIITAWFFCTAYASYESMIQMLD